MDTERIASALREFKEANCAIVITGHEIGPLFEVADEVVWLTAGTTHLLGSVDDARSHHAFGIEYLGSGARLPGR